MALSMMTPTFPCQRCLKYPELEDQYNNIHYNEAIERMGGKDNWHKHLWWDTGDLHVQPTFTPPFGKGYVN